MTQMSPGFHQWQIQPCAIVGWLNDLLHGSLCVCVYRWNKTYSCWKERWLFRLDQPAIWLHMDWDLGALVALLHDHRNSENTRGRTLCSRTIWKCCLGVMLECEPVSAQPPNLTAVGVTCQVTYKGSPQAPKSWVMDNRYVGVAQNWSIFMCFGLHNLQITQTLVFLVQFTEIRGDKAFQSLEKSCERKWRH